MNKIEKKFTQFIDISGVGNSGKSAVVDILREFNCINVFEHSFEFDIIRMSGGILNLYTDLVEKWSPVRSDAAIKKFLKIVELVGTSSSIKNPLSFLFSSGNRLNDRFDQEFIRLSKHFLQSFIHGSYKAYWPYDIIDANIFKRFYLKLCRKFKFNKLLLTDVYLASSTHQHFKEQFTLYMNALFSNLKSLNTVHVALNNAFEPFCPSFILDILDQSKIIIVKRDPRDVYTSGLSSFKINDNDKKIQAKENDGVNKTFLASDDLNLFIKRYLLYLNNVTNVSDPRILILNFEDLVFNYEVSLKKIMLHLNLSENDHQFKKKFFNPEQSLTQIGLWQKYSKQEEISIIANKLEKYLYIN